MLATCNKIKHSRRDFIKSSASGLFLPAIVGLVPKSLVLAAVPVPHRRSVNASSVTYLINQNFETPTTGYDNGETWSVTGTTVNPVFTPALLGTQSCELSGSLTLRLTSPTHTGLSESYYYWRTKFTTIPAGITTNYVTIIGPNFGIDVLSSGAVRVSGSQNGTPTTNTVSTGVEYFFLVHYLAGSGANGFYSVEFNTSATFSGSGNGYSQVTNGSETANSTNIRFLAEESTTATYVIDQILAAATMPI